MKNIIVCDIDGTLADNSHRRKFVEQKPKDWESFFDPDLVMKDGLNRTVKYIYDCLCRLHGDDSSTIAILLTGRMEKHREITLEWLSENKVKYDNLIMRRDNDYRIDYLWKEEVLLALDPKRILCAIEDRKSIVDLFRKHGVFCLDIAGYESNEEAIFLPPGRELSDR